MEDKNKGISGDDCGAKSETLAPHGVNRRKMLATSLGVMGLTLFPKGASFGATSSEGDKAARKKVRFYDNVAEMKYDDELGEGMMAVTLGYYKIGDGGGGKYRISILDKRKKADGGSLININKDKTAELIDISSVNYKMFGAKNDSDHDDGENIKQAHHYANKNKIPVINPTGEFWIKKTNNILIETDVEWGQTIFHIDEQYNSKNQPRFIVQGGNPSHDIDLEPLEKKKLLKKLRPGVKIIPELKPYKNSLIFISDKNDRIGYRYGYEGKSHAREEFFYVEEDGRIIGDIAWEFTDYTKLSAYPCANSYLKINGGTFYLSGNNPNDDYKGYLNNGFSITRSRTIIQNQWVGLENSNEDISLNPRRGFYSFSKVFDITLKNVRLIPWIQDRGDKDKNVGAGTYGISCNRTLQTRFFNVTAEGGKGYWGVFGNNFNKRFIIDRCNLNRVDVHFHCWNLHIKDSYIGFKGITVTGGGNLVVENTTVWSGHYFISFRKDFGSTWNGDIYINNCKHIPARKIDTGILGFSTANFNYHYPVHFGRNIFVQNFIIDYENIPDSVHPYRLMSIPTISQMKGGHRINFPADISFKNIKVYGREKGVRFLNIEEPQGYKLLDPASFDEDYLMPNCVMTFDSIHLEKMSDPNSSEDTHLLLNDHWNKNYLDDYALYPAINLKNCSGFSTALAGSANLMVNHCNVNFLKIGQKKPLKGEVDLNNCQLQPEVNNSKQSFYILSTESGVSFINCLFLAPKLDGIQRPELINNSGIIKLNQVVRYNHLNSRLSNSIRKYYKKNDISLSINFIDMLKIHNNLESEQV